MEKNIVKEFKKFAKNYNLKEYAIKRKLTHSIRVMKIAKRLAKKIRLSEEDIEIATLNGLLHDYARFEQWTQYQTYNDLDSVDHGDLAVRMLFENNEIKNFYQKEENNIIIQI